MRPVCAQTIYISARTGVLESHPHDGSVAFLRTSEALHYDEIMYHIISDRPNLKQILL